MNRAYNVDLGQKLAAVVALGYGASQGVPHRSKAPQRWPRADDGAPEWFKRGGRGPARSHGLKPAEVLLLA